MPLLENFTFRKGRFLVSVCATTLTALKKSVGGIIKNDTLKSMFCRFNVSEMQSQSA